MPLPRCTPPPQQPPTPPPPPAGKIPFEDAPQDDRQLPDLHLALYNDVIVFDHATKLAYVVSWVRGARGRPREGGTGGTRLHRADRLVWASSFR